MGKGLLGIVLTPILASSLAAQQPVRELPAVDTTKNLVSSTQTPVSLQYSLHEEGRAVEVGYCRNTEGQVWPQPMVLGIIDRDSGVVAYTPVRAQDGIMWIKHSLPADALRNSPEGSVAYGVFRTNNVLNEFCEQLQQP